MSLINRPSRFGKTMLLDMCHEFFRINPQNPEDSSYQKELFKGTQILDDKEFCDEYMGKWPVVYVSFKNVKASNFKDALLLVAEDISKAAKEHAYLLNSDKLTEYDKEHLQELINYSSIKNDTHLQCTLIFSLKYLSDMLRDHYGKKSFILMDNYDAPLDNAYLGGFYKEMSDLLHNMCSTALKENSSLKQGIMTGTLWGFQLGIFSGFNNVIIYYLTGRVGRLKDVFCLSEDEVHKLLEYYSLTEYATAVKEWYGGYFVDKNEGYRIPDVISFCDRAIKARKMGQESSMSPSLFNSKEAGDDDWFLEEFFSKLNGNDVDLVQHLLEGEDVEISVKEQAYYIDLVERPSSKIYWSLLLFNGYVTAIKSEYNYSWCNYDCTVRIPNRQMWMRFKKCVDEYNQKKNVERPENCDLVKHLCSCDRREVRFAIEIKLGEYLVAPEFKKKTTPLDFYVLSIKDLLSSCASSISNFKSHVSAVDGSAQIMFCSAETGIVMELKLVDEAELQEKSEEPLFGLKTKILRKTAKEALAQIDIKKYDDIFESSRVKKVNCYGGAFYKRECLFECETKEI